MNVYIYMYMSIHHLFHFVVDCVLPTHPSLMYRMVSICLYEIHAHWRWLLLDSPYLYFIDFIYRNTYSYIDSYTHTSATPKLEVVVAITQPTLLIFKSCYFSIFSFILSGWVRLIDSVCMYLYDECVCVCVCRCCHLCTIPPSRLLYVHYTFLPSTTRGNNISLFHFDGIISHHENDDSFLHRMWYGWS